ncbi:DegQ family serine endoprotease [Brucella pituitosa]|jgi:Do/DeqQ family serine protease|uniref:DegQ family serine endoprotease n=1 Tax=Brucella pituitosa TaxID=571256 RepID=A0A643F485_9HYPH|nr:DegQ family serine endoprotease [Brucella pituitosa]KAB0572963.1 DegQ family serine endoprotease [Brucella pituitosa]MCK4203459.1 DegQ family serine endoprotease [Brucella pituitosa]PJO46802.1 serine protease [Brucella pituitosa]PRA86046.1 serine protease [Ochrobactrum sp. MYb29]
MNWRRYGITGLVLASISMVTLPVIAQETAVPAQGKQIPLSRADMQLSFAPLVKETAPAVVNVYAARQVQQQSPFAGDPFFEQFFGKQFGGGGKSRTEQSLGSGVIVDASGIVVTNNHVIKDADEIKVALSDGRQFESKVLLRDETTDLAVLKIDAKEKFPVLALGNSDEVEVGDLVLAIGNPFGVGQTVTSGIVSAQSRTQVGVSDFDFFIQTDAAINPGNSGGGLLDMRGRLIGINTAIFSRSGGSVGIGFAIPSNMVRAVVDAALSGSSSFERPFIGATFQNITPDVAESLGMDKSFGVLVTAVIKGGPAEEAGLKVGDVVMSVQGVRADNVDVLGYRLSTAGIGNTVTLDIVRNGEESKLPVKLAKEPEAKPQQKQTIKGDNPFEGAVVEELTPSMASKMRLRDGARGVIVTDVIINSQAARLGLRQRDIIRGINGNPIRTIDDLTTALSNGRGLAWRLEVERNGALIRQFVR